MIVNSERHVGAGKSVSPLTRADVERLRSNVENAAQLDLRFQNLQHIDLSYMDLQGADLSTAHLNGPELRGASLHRVHRGAFFGDRGEQIGQGKVTRKRSIKAQSMLIEELSSPHQGQEGEQARQMFSDRDAYLFGEYALLVGSDSVKLRELFPQGFAFARARQLFDAWLVQAADAYNEQAIQAMWIGFAHRICDLYHEKEDSSSRSD